MIDRKNVWIRLGGNAKNIKAGGKEGWRFFISEAPIVIPSKDDEIPVIDWKLAGIAVPGVNVIPGMFKYEKPDDLPILVAWIDLFGDIEIGGDGVAFIQLRGT